MLYQITQCIALPLESWGYNIYTDLKQVVKYAMKQGIIYEDPLSGFDIEKPKASGQVVNVMTFAEYEAIVSNPENKKSYYLPAIMFLAETGLRVEELAIKKTDYHLTESGTAYISRIFIRLRKSTHFC